MEDFKSWGKKILKLTYQIFQAKNLQNLTLLDLIRSLESFTSIPNPDLAQSEDHWPDWLYSLLSVSTHLQWATRIKWTSKIMTALPDAATGWSREDVFRAFECEYIMCLLILMILRKFLAKVGFWPPPIVGFYMISRIFLTRLASGHRPL